MTEDHTDGPAPQPPLDDVLDGWLAQLCAALDVDPAVVDRQALLDVARDAAHGVARPAAPLTTFVVGLAAGRAAGDTTAVRTAVREAAELAQALALNQPGEA